MIDDELLQELLGKATGFYNNGEYKSAIETWKEALQVDPGSQKAREGIQMATLLLVGGEGAPEVVVEPEPDPPAEGGPLGIAGLSRAELEALLDQGISRVRGLLDQRKYSEAVEGARRLVPMDPDSEEVQRLVEEAQQAFEAAPFIEEHLTLARELASQERFEEAEAECRKVFALDRTNPDAHTLIADLRHRAQARRPAARAPEPVDAGGMTVKMDLSQLAAQFPPQEGGAPEPPSQGEPAAPRESARGKEEPLAEPLPSDMFDLELDLGPAEALPGDSAPSPHPPVEAEPEAPDESGTAVGAPVESEPEADVETVEAETVVPPSVRQVPRAGEAEPSAESWLERLEELGPAPPAQEAPGDEEVPAPPGDSGAPGAEASSWEQELESLNLKSGEHDILGRSAARTTTASPTEVDSDLSSLLSEDPASQTLEPGLPEEPPRAAPPPLPRTEERPRVAARPRPSRREEADEAPPPEAASHRAPVYFGLLGVVILAVGGTVWWFLFQPRTATGSVPSAVTPPAASSGEKPGTDHGPIPTPIGSTSRQPVQPQRGGNAGPAADVGPAADAEPAAAGAPANAQAPPPAPTAVPAESAPPTAPRPAPKTPEQLRSEVAHHMAEGRRFQTEEKWREARDEFAAVLALDPINFQAKELLDRTQERVNEETKVRQDLTEAKSAFEQKDFQGALWKLYRLPRDPRLGDIDLRIRNAWFNWAVLGLKNGDATNALQKLGEALSADPGDAEAVNVQEVAQRYASKPKDKVFYSYVETLKFRAFDQK